MSDERVYGRFHDRFPRIPLSLPATDGEREVEFLFDTGFDGDLTLPPDIVRVLEVTAFAPQEHRLADGSYIEARVCRALVEWLGEERDVEILVMETNPLLGTALIEGCHIDFEAVEGGEVLIEPLN